MDNTYFRYESLKKKIYNKLNSKFVQSEGDIISLYDLYQAIGNEFSEFKYLNAIKKQQIRKYNTRLFKCTPLIENVSFDIVNGSEHIYYKFKSINDLIYHQILMLDINYDKYQNYSNKHLKAKISKSIYHFLDISKEYNDAYIDILTKIKNKYPDFNFTLDDGSINEYDTFVYHDEFLSFKFSLSDLSCDICLDDINDIAIATSNLYKEGQLYDYLINFKDIILKKTAVNINDLNPLYQEIVKKYMDINLNKVLFD